MRKLLSIPLIFLILITGINIRIATHYCAGSVFGTKVSLTGELVSCGMEHHETHKSKQEIISNHCCEDVMSSVSVSNTYMGSDVQTVHHTLTLHAFNFPPFIVSSEQGHTPIINCSASRPPGMNDLFSPAIQTICVYRI